MKLIHLSNYFNHHVKPLADALYNILGDDYAFIETEKIPQFRLKLGYKAISAPYLMKYSIDTQSHIEDLLMEADVVIYGEAPLNLIKDRYRSGKLTFRDDESRYKNPNRYLKWPVYSYNSYWINKGYLLCASAYAPVDYALSGLNPEKCFKWGYFPEVRIYNNAEELMGKKGSKHHPGVSILWAGRLIGLKHPEYAIYVAKRLKKDGVAFAMNIIGAGVLEGKILELIKNENLINEVHLLGSMSPIEVRKYMEKADIFLFTSDRCEGWGAVLNESLNSGCAVVADGNIGSVPFLIKDGVNGMIYSSTNKKNLYEKVYWLVNHPEEIRGMGLNAYNTMVETWNGVHAANNLIELSESLLKGGKNPIGEGPCSHAPLLMRRWRGKINVL